MTISVVIVSYNTRAILIKCLRALYASQGIEQPLQIIVVDNASMDGSPEAVAEEFPEVELIRVSVNLGFSKANNIGINKAKGEYILLLNPDAIVESNVLQVMSEYLRKDLTAGMVGCKLVTADGKLDLACRRKFPTVWDGFCRATGLSAMFPQYRVFAGYNLGYLDESETYPVDCINGAFMLCKREAIVQVGLMDEEYFMYAEDMDWCMRFKNAGWQVIYHPAATTLHLKGASSKHYSQRMIREFFRSNERFYRKHCYGGDGLLKRLATLGGLKVWLLMTLLRNELRTKKKARP